MSHKLTQMKIFILFLIIFLALWPLIHIDAKFNTTNLSADDNSNYMEPKMFYYDKFGYLYFIFMRKFTNKNATI